MGKCSTCHWISRNGRCLNNNSHHGINRDQMSDNDTCSFYEMDFQLKRNMEQQERERKEREREREERQKWIASEEGQRWQAEEERKKRERLEREKREQEEHEREKREYQKWLATDEGQQHQKEVMLSEQRRCAEAAFRNIRNTIIRCIIGGIIGFFLGVLLAIWSRMDINYTALTIIIGVVPGVIMGFITKGDSISECVRMGAISYAIIFLIFSIIGDFSLADPIIGAIGGAIGGIIIGAFGGIFRNDPVLREDTSHTLYLSFSKNTYKNPKVSRSIEQKTCEKCGKKVNEDIFKCPECRNESFI